MTFLEQSAQLTDRMADITGQSFNLFFQHIANNPNRTTFTLLTALASYLIINLYKFRLTKKMKNRTLMLFLNILFPFLVVVFTYYTSQKQPKEVMYITLNYLAFYWLAGAIMHVPSRFFDIKMRGGYSVVMAMILTSILISVYVAVIHRYGGHIGHKADNFVQVMEGASKTFLSIGFWIYLNRLLPPLFDMIRQKNPDNHFIMIPPKVYTTAFAALSVPWILRIFHFDLRVMLITGLVVLASAILSYISTASEVIANKFYHSENYSSLEWTLINKHIVRLFTVSFIFLFYTLGYSLMDLDEMMHQIRIFYIINTSLFKLSAASFLSAMLVFMLLRSALFLTAKYMRVAMNHGKQNSDSASVEVLFSNIGMLFVIVVTMLDMGVTWQIIIPVAGALGIGFGFGLQTIINNYVSGFILLFSKKVKIGDYIELSGTAGRILGVTSDTIFGNVTSIDMFSTTVKTFDNIEVMIPNAALISDTLVNYTRSDTLIRFRIPVGIGYSSDVELAKKLMVETISSIDHVATQKMPDVWFSGYGASSLDFIVTFWVDINNGFTSTEIQNIFLQSLWQKFKEHDIEIPFPQQDVWLRSVPAQKI